MRTLRDVQNQVKEWADSVIPNRTPLNALHKMVLEEIPELLVALKETGRIDPGEIADVLIIALDLAAMQGIDAEDAIMTKLEVNRRRRWDVKLGILQHIKEGDDES